jgi:hypothetical protein
MSNHSGFQRDYRCLPLYRQRNVVSNRNQLIHLILQPALTSEFPQPAYLCMITRI